MLLIGSLSGNIFYLFEKKALSRQSCIDCQQPSLKVLTVSKIDALRSARKCYSVKWFSRYVMSCTLVSLLRDPVAASCKFYFLLPLPPPTTFGLNTCRLYTDEGDFFCSLHLHLHFCFAVCLQIFFFGYAVLICLKVFSRTIISKDLQICKGFQVVFGSQYVQYFSSCFLPAVSKSEGLLWYCICIFY